MARRRVTEIKKDETGGIVALFNTGAMWSPIRKDKAIMEIESGLNKYFIHIPGVGEVDIVVVNNDSGKKLQMDMQ